CRQASPASMRACARSSRDREIRTHGLKGILTPTAAIRRQRCKDLPMSLTPRHASVALLLLAPVSPTGCRAEPDPRSATAAPAPSPPPPAASVPVPASNASGAAASAVPDPSAALDDYAKSAENPGCTLRRNSGTLVTCEVYQDNLGAWAPSPRETVAVMQL